MSVHLPLVVNQMRRGSRRIKAGFGRATTARGTRIRRVRVSLLTRAPGTKTR